MIKPRRATEKEVRQRWALLPLEKRLQVCLFEDVVLVDRIRTSLQSLFQKQVQMQSQMLRLGITLKKDAADPFEASALLTRAFEFSWMVARHKTKPGLVVMKADQQPVMTVKSCLLESDMFFDAFCNVLPDFLQTGTGRHPMPRPRWKELWAEPTSISGLEQQLVRLVEQALWLMAADPAYEPPSISAASFARCEEEHTPRTPARKAAEKKKKQKKGKRSPGFPSAADRGSPKSCTEAGSDCGASSTACDSAQTPQTELSVSTALNSRFSILEDVDDLVAQSDCDSMVAALPEEVCSGTGAPPVGDLRVKGERGLRPPATPPTSPTAPHLSWQPPQLVCYIWNQTSQMDVDDCDCQSECGSLVGTPATPDRGQWLPAGGCTSPTGLSAVVRNTFLDLGKPLLSVRSSRTRSLSAKRMERSDSVEGRDSRRA